jgi:hypothetical protein
MTNSGECTNSDKFIPPPSKPPKPLSRPMELTAKQKAAIQRHVNAGSGPYFISQLYKKFMDENARIRVSG